MKKTLLFFASSALACLGLWAAPISVHADEAVRSPPHPRERPEWSGGSWSLDFLPRLYSENSVRYGNAFVSNALPAPAENPFALGIRFSHRRVSGFDVGIGFEFSSASRDAGTFIGSFEHQLIGLTFAYHFLPIESNWDVRTGTLVAWGEAQVEVLSSIRNGRLTESGLALQPSIGFSYRITPAIHLGLEAAYLAPVAQSTEAKGQSLGIEHALPQGSTLALAVSLGGGVYARRNDSQVDTLSEP